MEQPQEISSHSVPLDSERQEMLLRESEHLVPDLVSQQAFRQLLGSGGALRVLLAELVRARTICREKLAEVPFEQGEKAVLMGIKLQGQMKGIDLAIDLIFEIANWQEEEHDGERRDN